MCATGPTAQPGQTSQKATSSGILPLTLTYWKCAAPVNPDVSTQLLCDNLNTLISVTEPPGGFSHVFGASSVLESNDNAQGLGRYDRNDLKTSVCWTPPSARRGVNSGSAAA
ncbi:hypothetical protein Q5P01_011717 [Channa striata]|uniref:Uncharacterized protein n=1 Tax=Channa striata TaxID=64152 RepID=A0AA88MY16_CHASR|nr:hypothetical protein Q5P01_011717 [Channa striata]